MQCEVASLQGRHSYITGVQARCKKMKMICVHWFNGHLILHLGLHWWGVGVPDVLFQQMSNPPSDPLIQVHTFDVLNVDLAYLALGLG